MSRLTRALLLGVLVGLLIAYTSVTLVDILHRLARLENDVNAILAFISRVNR